MNEQQPTNEKDLVDRSTESLRPLPSATFGKHLYRVISIIGQESIDNCKHLSSEINIVELQVQTQGRALLEKVCQLVDKVEEADLKLRSEGISQKAVSKKNLIEFLTGRSKFSYYKNYYPIWEYRDYLWDEQTESPTSIAHANRIIKNHLSAQKRGESMAQSTQSKTAMLTLVAKLEAELKEAQETIKLLTESLRTKDRIINQFLDKEQ